jgi:UDP-2,3-diacylglucosamine pyrophosphatase LpxH
MTTKKLIDSALKKDSITLENPSKKIVILSDMHLGAGGSADSSLKNNIILYTALQKYYEEDYIIILNGDCFEIAENSLDDVKKAHEDLMWLLSKIHEKGHLIILRGNHDYYLKDEDLANRPCSYTKKEVAFLSGIKIKEYCKLIFPNKNYIVIHGHQSQLSYTLFNKIVVFLLRYFVSFFKKWFLKEITSETASFAESTKYIKAFEDYTIDNTTFICGHTHSTYTQGKQYLNDGCCVYPRSITGIEIDNGEVKFFKWRRNAIDDFIKIEKSYF